MSAHATRPEPPPSAYPCTAQTTGAGQESIVSSMRYSRIASSTFSSKSSSIEDALPLDVRAGAEARPFAREHDRARVPDVGERLRQLRDERGVERVAALGPREGDAQDLAVAIDPERAHRRKHMVWTMAAKRFTVTLEREYVEWIEERSAPDARVPHRGHARAGQEGETAR